LIEALRDKEWTVRRNAALALGKMGADARSAAGALGKLRRDPDHLVRKAAQEALPKVKS
jgi:HEAT repeat protein